MTRSWERHGDGEELDILFSDSGFKFLGNRIVEVRVGGLWPTLGPDQLRRSIRLVARSTAAHRSDASPPPLPLFGVISF